MRYYEEKTVEPVGTYWSRRDAFKAIRSGTMVTVAGYFNNSTQIPAETKFATLGFAVNSGTLTLIETGGGKAYSIVVSYTDGSLSTESAIPTGYYRISGCVGVQSSAI